MRQYECECLICNKKRQITFKEEPYPELEEVFQFHCDCCNVETQHIRVLTKKAAAELRRKQQEEELRNSILKKCAEYGFACRFLYQSVIITTNISDWCFDYHLPRIKLYHESTIKVNWKTGDYAKSHVQFENVKMTPTEVIEYIAKHDAWRENQK